MKSPFQNWPFHQFSAKFLQKKVGQKFDFDSKTKNDVIAGG